VTAREDDVLARVREYIAEDVRELERDLAPDPDDAAIWPLVQVLRDKAREREIYTPQLPRRWGGLGLGPVAMCRIHETCGAIRLAPLGLNAMAPDEGNMHTLLAGGSAEQLERWLRPLAEGRIRSCFAMTEPHVASSDPLNLEATAVRQGDEWVLNGSKWFITGADGAALAIVVARTADHAERHRAYSLFLVPTDTAGFELVRRPHTIGPHFVGGHAQVALKDVRVPLDHLLGEEGAGFALAQERLAGGRLAHAARWLGLAQHALALAAAHVQERSAFGRRLSEHQGVQFPLADSAIELHASRLMLLDCATKVEKGLPHRVEVSMVKTFVSEALGRVLDRAVQLFGSHGIATDRPIAQWYADARAARIYDGASEVHRMVIARDVLRTAEAGI
jgi:acyl-CoA dehydrogenase